MCYFLPLEVCKNLNQLAGQGSNLYLGEGLGATGYAVVGTPAVNHLYHVLLVRFEYKVVLPSLHVDLVDGELKSEGIDQFQRSPAAIKLAAYTFLALV